MDSVNNNILTTQNYKESNIGCPVCQKCGIALQTNYSRCDCCNGCGHNKDEHKGFTGCNHVMVDGRDCPCSFFR